LDELVEHEQDRERPALAALHAVLDATPEPRLVIGSDARIRMANAAAGALLGYDVAALVDRPLDVLAPDDRDDQLSMLRRAWLDSPQPGQLGRGMDLRARRQDGTEVPVELQVAPMETADELIAIVSIRDVTEVEHDTRLFRGLLESAPDAVVIVDATGRIRLVNATLEKWFGYAREELIGQRVEVLIPERLAGKHTTLRGGYLAHPRPRPLGLGEQLTARRKDGTEFPAEISLAPVHTDDGLLIVADIRDVTERLAVKDAMRQAEERERIQQETNRAKDEFLATVSHELRTPLASMIGFGELVEEMDDLPPQSAHFLSVIMRNARRELRLVNDLLTLVNINEHGLRIHCADVDLVPLAVAAVESASPETDRAHVRVVLDAPADLPVRCDADRMGQVLDNLLSNAVKFSLDGGDVHLTLRAEGDAAVIEVTDSGMGIGEPEYDRIFERLYRTQAAVEREIPGAGLGLSIAAAIVAAHEGTIRVVRSDESGTTFRVRIPRAEAGAPAGAEPPQNSRSVGSSRPRRAS
jgi:protein-histidine pros-kinase